ncbi:MAG TPA: geranylgeranylglycerol-phosphate geranylgeranyltransferase, partial [archaeon]|nr:geranylgeranylglycerol-phosphate geranylgeranyltransferase [archaeon]
MNAWLEILRPANCLMAAIAVLVGMLLVVTKLGASFSLPVVLLAAVAAFLIAGAGNAVNDCVDVEADRVNRPKRPIPSGRISRGAALNYSIALFALGIFLAAAIFQYTGLWWPAAIAAVNSGLLILYAFRLKDSLLIVNIVVSYLVGSSFLFGGAAAGDLLLPLLLTLLAALANLGREVAKTLEDLEGDRVGFLRKLARKA